MTLKTIAPPAREPVDLALAKTFIRVDNDAENDVIAQLIGAAREILEARLGRVFITRELELTVPLPEGPIIAFKPVPIGSVASVTVQNADGDATALAAPSYRLDLRREPAELCLQPGYGWTAGLADADRLIIRFSAGYGENSADIPLPIRQAILLLTAHLYTYRDSAETPPEPVMIDALLMPYRWYRL